ncbi:MAG TPA: ROK family transcriptional regulator [Ktedonobacteraceae bacterium]|nr:ROK family transcriptional regulator [Ktedonobacteraceae bacterium]
MSKVTITARDMRRHNRKTVLQQIYQRQPISRLEVSQLSGLSTGTVTTVVGELLAEGIIQEVGFEASDGGRPRVLLSLKRDYGYVLGCELGETRLTLQLFDVMLTRLASFHTALKDEEENTPEFVVDVLRQGVAKLLTEADAPPEKVLGMGIGFPGVVEHSQNMRASSPIWHWEPIPLMAMLRQHFTFPLFLENGSKTMALAERHATSIDNMAFVNIGIGVGAGIISGGKLYRGATDSAGEWGHTIIALDGAPCRCGHYGCMEAYVGALGILRTLRSHDPASPFLRHHDPVVSLNEIVVAAQAGDATALQTLQETTHYLGAGVANLINLFNPSHVIIGGWVGLSLGPTIMDELQKVVERYALRLALDSVHLHISAVGPDAASLGAALLAIEDFLARGGRMAAEENKSNRIQATHELSPYPLRTRP